MSPKKGSVILAVVALPLEFNVSSDGSACYNKIIILVFIWV